MTLIIMGVETKMLPITIQLFNKLCDFHMILKSCDVVLYIFDLLLSSSCLLPLTSTASGFDPSNSVCISRTQLFIFISQAFPFVACSSSVKKQHQAIIYGLYSCHSTFIHYFFLKIIF